MASTAATTISSDQPATWAENWSENERHREWLSGLRPNKPDSHKWVAEWLKYERRRETLIASMPIGTFSAIVTPELGTITSPIVVSTPLDPSNYFSRLQQLKAEDGKPFFCISRLPATPVPLPDWVPSPKQQRVSGLFAEGTMVDPGGYPPKTMEKFNQVRDEDRKLSDWGETKEQPTMAPWIGKSRQPRVRALLDGYDRNIYEQEALGLIGIPGGVRAWNAFDDERIDRLFASTDYEFKEEPRLIYIFIDPTTAISSLTYTPTGATVVTPPPYLSIPENEKINVT